MVQGGAVVRKVGVTIRDVSQPTRFPAGQRPALCWPGIRNKRKQILLLDVAGGSAMQFDFNLFFQALIIILKYLNHLGTGKFRRKITPL